MADSSSGPDGAARYRANLQGEVDSAMLYRAMADAEEDPKIKQIYRRLASVEDAHAELWRRELRRIGARLPRRAVGWRARALAWLARRFGPQYVLPTINTLEQQDSTHYDDQPEAVAGGLPGHERSHARVLRAIERTPGTIEQGRSLARFEGRHRGMAGNSLRAAVLGANDGLVSNLSLVMGMAGATTNEGTVLISGLAGLVAGACSMALGEWLSVNSSRELYQRQIDTERHELETIPDEEKEEMVLIYQAKGLDEPQARALAERLMKDKKTALDTLVREELGIDPEELGGSAWAAAGASFCLFSAGAIFPVIPYMILTGWAALAGSIVLSGLALALIGAGTSLFTGRHVGVSALRQVAIGLVAAAITYGVGRALGVSLS